MATIDKVKEKISLAKFALGILLGMIFTVIGWLVSNYLSANNVLIILGFVWSVILVYGIVFLIKYILIKIDSLEEL